MVRVVDHGPLKDQIPLQWSHVFSDMVRTSILATGGYRQEASMEPCLFRHGKGIFTLVGRGASQASMEPCLFRHGKGGVCPVFWSGPGGFNGAMSFQTW